MKKLSLLLLAALALAGCSTAPTPTSQPAPIDWATVDYGVQMAAKYSTAAVLNNNPKYAGGVAAITGGVGALLVGVPTPAGISAAIHGIAPDLAAADVTTLASVVADAYGLYTAKTGRVELLAADPIVQGLVAALTAGITQGVALHGSTLAGAAR